MNESRPIPSLSSKVSEHYFRIGEYVSDILSGEKNNLYLTIRWVLLIGFTVRMVLFKSYATTRFVEGFYLYNFVVLGAFFIYLCVLSWLISAGRPSIRSANFYGAQVILDLLFFATIYVLSARVQSDTFLAFFLPLLIAAENRRGRGLISAFFFMALILVVSIVTAERMKSFLILANVPSDSPTNYIRLFAGDAAPRVVAFLFFTIVGVMRSHTFQRQAEELNVINDTLINIPKANTFEERLEAVLEDARKLLNGDGSVVMRLSSDGESLKVVALQGIKSPIFQVGYKLAKGKGVAWNAIEIDKPIIETLTMSNALTVPIPNCPSLSKWAARYWNITNRAAGRDRTVCPDLEPFDCQTFRGARNCGQTRPAGLFGHAQTIETGKSSWRCYSQDRP